MYHSAAGLVEKRGLLHKKEDVREKRMKENEKEKQRVMTEMERLMGEMERVNKEERLGLGKKGGEGEERCNDREVKREADDGEMGREREVEQRGMSHVFYVERAGLEADMEMHTKSQPKCVRMHVCIYFASSRLCVHMLHAGVCTRIYMRTPVYVHMHAAAFCFCFCFFASKSVREIEREKINAELSSTQRGRGTRKIEI